MNFFQKLGHSLSSFFGSPAAHAVEKEVAIAAAPLAEKALIGLAGASPLVSVVVSVVEPVMAEEITKLEAPRPSSAP